MLKTRLCSFFEIDHPIILAPMAFAAGGRLAAAVSNAGGLGLLGGGYGDGAWIEQQIVEAQNTPIGCGFITWHLEKALRTTPDLLDKVLKHAPKALCLSFDDPAPYLEKIRQAGVPLICQVQTVRDARHAIDLGVDVLVAQGSEAGGHGQARATMTLVPEVADSIAKHAPHILLCAAGGIADGRGLAAALMLGADGVMVGSRLWASQEALVHPQMHQAALTATGDETIRSKVMDLARHLHWPERYTARVLQNAFTERWHDDLEGLLRNAEAQAALWKTAWQEGNTTIANTFVGEATGLIDQVLPVEQIIKTMVQEAHTQLQRFA